MFAPKSVSGGVADRTVEYTTWVLGITVFAQSFHCNREFRGQSCSAVLVFRNPRKAMSAPKSVSRGVAGSYCWVYYIGINKENSVFAQYFHCKRKFRGQGWSAVSCTHFPQPPESNVCRLPPKVSLEGLLHGYWGLQYLLNLSIATENFEAKAVRLYSFSATPGKQCLPPKVSQGGLRDRTVEYTTWA